MNRMHLTARPTNEGARKLAQWVLRQPAGAFDALAARIGTGIIGLDRMIAGEVTPGESLGYSIFVSTGCAVETRDFYRPAKGGWFDPVEPKADRRAA